MKVQYKNTNPKSRKSLNWLFCVFVVVIFYFFYLMWNLTFPYFKENYINNFLLTKQAIQHSKIWNISFFVHITTSLFVLLFGVFQFSKYIKIRFPKIHKTFGFAYLLLVLLFAAPSSLVMGFYANGGIWAKMSFIVLAILWWVFTYNSFIAIKIKDFVQHQNYSIRSYALTLSAISLRLLVVCLPHFFIINSSDMYTLISFLSWIPNLIIAECIIHRKRN